MNADVNDSFSTDAIVLKQDSSFRGSNCFESVLKFTTDNSVHKHSFSK